MSGDEREGVHNNDVETPSLQKVTHQKTIPSRACL